jgi:hypothetical protein
VKQLLLWIRDHKLSSAGLVLVILGCVALVNLSHRVHHLKPRAAARESASGVASPAPPAQAATEPVARSAAMRAEFEAAANYLDFIPRALSRPEEGGAFYALLAWKRCNHLHQHPDIAATHTGSEAFHDAAVALVADLDKRCAGVLQNHADAPTLYKRALEQGGARDPLLPPEGRGIVAPPSIATAEADIDAALKTGDPWAAAAALRDNAGLLDVGNPSGDPAVDRQLREWAGQVVACEVEGSCRGGIEASLHCAASGDCTHEDYRDIVLAQVPDTQRIIFDTILAGLHERMRPVLGPTGGGDRP